MSTTRASSNDNDHEGLQEESLSARPGKGVSVKKPRVKKASAAKTQ